GGQRQGPLPRRPARPVPGGAGDRGARRLPRRRRLRRPPRARQARREVHAPRGGEGLEGSRGMARRRRGPGLREGRRMIAELGAFALVLALALSAVRAGLSVAGRVRRSAVLAAAGEGAAIGAALCVALAFAA